MFRRKVCRLLMFIAFCTFIQTLPLIYYKVSRRKRSFTDECSVNQNKEMFHSRLYLDEKGEIMPAFTGNSECYPIKTNSTGVNRFTPKGNFIVAECKDVIKRFLKENETTYKTALVSLPGSGNTWVRHLLEEVTGIYTGSIYNSSWIRDIFMGENTTDHVIVVKTHRSAEKLMPGRFGRAVLIIRDPFDTALSEFNRENTQSKTGIVTEEELSNSSKVASNNPPRNLDNQSESITEHFFSAFVHSLNTRVTSWQNFNSNWLKLFPGPIFVLFYDKLKTDLKNSMAKLSLFLEAPITLKDLWCADLRREGLFHRPSKPEYMLRSKLLDSKLETRIENAKKELVNICMDPINKNRIKANL